MTNKTILSGVLLLDKSIGISSNDAVFAVKKRLMSDTLNTKKAGHTGTLDPMATGLLPICFGSATAFASFGLDADKGYRATLALGVATDTGDQEGQVVESRAVPTLDDEVLQHVAQSFLGKQSQIPPMYSALKKDGKKLYEYARAGIEVERPARDIEILALSLHLQSPTSLTLDVVCSKGTYVRTLGEDIAKALGTVGHLTALRRTSTGGFDLDKAVTLDDVTLDAVLPIDSLLAHLPSLPIDSNETARLKMGQRLNIKDRLSFIGFGDDTALVRLYDNDAFVGLGEVATTGRLQPKKMV